MGFDDILDAQPTKDEFDADEAIDELEKEADEAIDEAMDILVNGDDEDKVDAAKNLVDTAETC